MLAQIIAFIVAHQVVLAALGAALLDLIFALNPAAASNGMLHWVWLWLTGKKDAAPVAK